MELRKITSDFPDMERIDRIAKEAFPPEEYISPQEMVGMSENSSLELWGLYDNDNLVGFMVTTKWNKIAYLFFLAIDASCRSKGYGAKALGLFTEQFPEMTHVVDMEMPDNNASNSIQRLSRKKFYLRNGYRETGHCLRYLGIDFEVLCKEDNFNIKDFKKLMQQLPVRNFHPRFFTKS